MEKKITICVCSKKQVNEKNDLIENIKETCQFDAHIHFITNDGISLTKVYNEILGISNTNIIVFIHDDIEFLSKGWGKRLVEIFETNKDYGIIGVAGSAEFDNESCWWNYKNKYGQVLHRNNGKSWLTTFSPLLDKDLEEVCVIDGLFMAVNKERITKRFDEDFEGFNHYDTSFCLSNFIDGKTKIGVTTDIRIAHNSVGELKDNWFANKELLTKKFEKYYPIKLKK